MTYEQLERTPWRVGTTAGRFVTVEDRDGRMLMNCGVHCPENRARAETVVAAVNSRATPHVRLEVNASFQEPGFITLIGTKVAFEEVEYTEKLDLREMIAAMSTANIPQRQQFGEQWANVFRELSVTCLKFKP